MIKINLAPDEELENKYWWVPLVGIIVIVFLVSQYALDLYLEDLRNQASAIAEETQEHKRGFDELKSKQDEFKARDAERIDLQNRLASLQRITESKILRYRPVILLEHLQNLKPEGIWFSRVSLLKSTPDEEEVPPPELQQQDNNANKDKADEDKANPAEQIRQRINQEADMHEISITGRAFDNILVAEFMSALKSTQTQEIDPTSLRTMVYFSEITLAQTVKATETLVSNQLTPQEEQNPNQGNQIFNTAGGPPAAQNQGARDQRQERGEIVTEFEITLKFREHPSPVKNPAMQSFSFKPDFRKRFTMY